eukprot:7647120-Ditylum_brightwellii.AAC.1
MKDAYRIFQKKEILEQSHHPFDIQKNEGMNTAIAKFAPKTRTFSRTMSLQNRVSIAVGVQNNGNDLYWSRVYTALGMEMLSNLSSFWKKEDNTTKKKRQRHAS